MIKWMHKYMGMLVLLHKKLLKMSDFIDKIAFSLHYFLFKYSIFYEDDRDLLLPSQTLFHNHKN
jgi:hypothetical protein